MKYRDEQGKWQDLYLSPTGDTLPIGTVVDYDGDEVPYGYEKVDNVKSVQYDVLFDGIGTKATNQADYFSTIVDGNPKEYDIVIISISNQGSAYENQKVILTPKINPGTNGIITYMGATTQYFAYLRLFCDDTSIKHRVTQIQGWALGDLYVNKVIGIKFV